jgi:NitT/TauT family transport system substrate-binding protein
VRSGVKDDSPHTQRGRSLRQARRRDTLNNINTTTINEAVRKDGGAIRSTISYVELAFPDIPPAVAKGDVDAGQVVEPVPSRPREQTGDAAGSSERTWRSPDPNLTVAMYFTSATATPRANTPPSCRSSPRRCRSHCRYASGNPDAAREIVSSYTKIDPAVQKALT